VFDRRGQVLLLAIAIFASILLFTLYSINKSSLKIAKYVGELQSTMVLQISREYVSDISMDKNIDLNELVNKLYGYNTSLGIFIGRLSYLYYNYTDLNIDDGYGNYTLIWNIVYPYLSNKVRFTFYWNYSLKNYYYKNIEGVVAKYSNYSLYVEHRYVCPQFDVRLNPCIYAFRRNIVDLRYIGDGCWIIGIPRGSIEKLYDEYDIVLKVGG